MAMVVVACQEASLTVSEGKAESMRLRSVPSPAETGLYISVAGQR